MSGFRFNDRIKINSKDVELKRLSITSKTLSNFLECIAQLYEPEADVRRIGKYVRPGGDG